MRFRPDTAMYPGVELRLLRYASVVAEELNFTRAAARLHVSQPSLSRQIRQLEDDLGFKLFRRTNRWVEVTPAGRRFVEEARKALAHADRAVEAAKRVSAAEREIYTVGYCPFIDMRFISALRGMKPLDGAKFVFRSAPYAEVIAKTATHEWEAGLVVLPVLEPGLAVEPLLREPLVAAVPASHRLSNKRQIYASDLKDETLIVGAKQFGSPFHDQLCAALRTAGIQASDAVMHDAATPHEALHLVADGLGIALAQPSAFSLASGSAQTRIVRGLDVRVDTGLVVNRESDSRALKSFIEAVRVISREYLRESNRDLQISA